MEIVPITLYDSVKCHVILGPLTGKDNSNKLHIAYQTILTVIKSLEHSLSDGELSLNHC
jgi:hypothetical protein